MPRSRRPARALAIAERRRRPDPVSWWMWALLAASLLAAGAVRAQTPATPATPPVPPTEVPNTVVPEIVTPTIPPGAGGSGTTTPQPRSENPQTNGTTAPIPDRGIITPPANPGQTPVIRPPSGGTSDMPVIPPPGSPGGNPAVIPR